MEGKTKWRGQGLAVAVFVLLAVAALVLVALHRAAAFLPTAATPEADGGYTSTTFAMDTIVQQKAYGPNAIEAMRQVNLALAAWDARLSLFSADGDIARINAGAGSEVRVEHETAKLLRQALGLSAQSEGAFALSIAPITLAWGVTGDAPRVPSEAEINALLPLVDDAAVRIEGEVVTLPRPGMGLDLGGIAKGAACGLAADIYAQNGVEGALLWVGGNTYALGAKPDGSLFRIGFEDPRPGGEASLGSILLKDRVLAVSGGYNRYFEADGKRYIHIFNPATGQPAESDILSVGVLCANGAEADFWSTTLFVWGKARTLKHMRAGGTAIMLDEAGKLWVSESLKESFMLNEHADVAAVEFVPGG